MAHKFLGAISMLLLWAIPGLFAQRDNVWAFGTHAGIDFNSGLPVAINTSINSSEACASASNENGQLQFYTNGERVWDRDNNFMQNGFSICSYGVTSTAQGALIVPFPDSSFKYYIFSLTCDENGPSRGRLFYSVVDMELNNGLGAVVEGRKEILIATGLQENMTAVAGTTCNIWLLTIDQQGILKAFNIDHNGIDTIPIQSPLISGTFIGSMSVSPDRTKLAIADKGLVLYDFDATSGTTSNTRELIPPAPNLWMYAVCFSPDNSKIYTALGHDGLQQFDISSGIQSDIVASMTLVPGPNPATGALKLAPDGKIYFARSPGPFLGVIHQPNQAAAACAYDPQGLALANTTAVYLGLPNVVPTVVPTGDTIIHTESIGVNDCFVNSYSLQADTLANNYIWDNGATASTRVVDNDGTYWVRYHKHCTVYIDTFKVTFPNTLPDLDVQAACRHQDNGSATLLTDNSGYVYYWRNEAGDTLSTSHSLQEVAGGSYTVHVVTPDGCDTQLVVEIPEEDYRAAFLVDSIVCQGSALSFINSSDSHLTEFEWDFGDGATASEQNPVHSYTHTGSYTTRLIASGTVCTDTAFQMILVDSQLTGQYRLSRDSSCIGESVTFLPDGDSSIVSRFWQFGDGAFLSEYGEENIPHAYDSAGSHPVYVSTQYRACPATDFTDTLHVFAPPLVYLGSDSSLCLKGKAIVLSNQSTDQFPATYYWSTGDTTATIRVLQPGNYKLTVSSAPLGCTNSDVVMVSKDCYINIPNAFTPNEDGENDYFFPRQLLSKNLLQFNMQIVNRWGQVVFQTNSTDGRGWDGKFNSNPQPAGVYIYLISLTVHPGKEEQYTGNVTLLR